MCNLHQFTKKYVNKVPIFSYFLCKFPIFFLFFGINSYFPIFLPFLLLDALQWVLAGSLRGSGYVLMQLTSGQVTAERRGWLGCVIPWLMTLFVYFYMRHAVHHL